MKQVLQIQKSIIIFLVWLIQTYCENFTQIGWKAFWVGLSFLSDKGPLLKQFYLVHVFHVVRVHQPTFKARIHLHQDQHRILKLNKKKTQQKDF